MNTQTEIRQRITERIVQALKAGTPPWRKTWRSDANCGTPKNAVSGNGYRGINILLLELAALERGYESKWWASYRQWQALGGQVRRGEHGTQIVFWKPVVRKVTVKENDQEEVESFPILRTWTIFNVAQVQGDAVETFRHSSQTSGTFVDYGPAEEVLAATKADIRFGGNHAFYQPHGDFIQLPPRSSFLGQHEFYHTAYHELCHNADFRIMPRRTPGTQESQGIPTRLLGIITTLPERQATRHPDDTGRARTREPLSVPEPSP